MIKYIAIFLLCMNCIHRNFAQTKTIHVFVALCDNQFQGIVPVPQILGNGKKPKQNLYWGALYGVRSYFKNKTKDWKFVKQIPSTNPIILDRVLFKHVKKEVYLLADAYDGEHIKACIQDFLKASNAQNELRINDSNRQLSFGGKSNLLAYVGHDGLMDFKVNINYNTNTKVRKEVFILACFSKDYFSSEIKKANAKPLLWTTHLMAPEAYTLKAAIEAWIDQGNGQQIKEKAAQQYHKYQKCGITNARNLFTSGF